MKTFVLFALMIALVSVAMAADVTGTWKGQRPGRDGAMMDVTFKFQSSGSQLTGSTMMRDNEIQISEGKISGDDISFVVKMEFGGNSVKMNYTGKVSGSEMKLKSQREGSDRVMEFSLKKS